MRYLNNAFSAGMLAGTATVRFTFLSLDQAREWMHGDPVQSCVGHPDTAHLVSSLLGREVAMNRVTTKLQKGDHMLVAQYFGPRLAEGAVSLPEGARIEWILASVE